MVFSVKATYRGETRKLSFSECGNCFPSFDQIYNQLYRVFPISHSFYLSKLLFSPDSSKSRILLAREVHTDIDYARCTAQFVGRSYPNPLLRFSVFDETPHKVPKAFLTDSVSSSTNCSTVPLPEPLPFTPISAFIPPPPIIYSSQLATTDVDPSTPASTIRSTLFPQYSEPQHSSNSTPRPLYTPMLDRADIESLITKFKDDLDTILRRNFGPATVPTTIFPELVPTPVPSLPSLPIMCLYKFCMPCGKIFQGPWYTCEKCNTVVCPTCHDLQLSNYCLAAPGLHVLKKETCPACPKEAPPSTVSTPASTPVSSSVNAPWRNFVPLPTPSTSSVPGPQLVNPPTVQQEPSIPAVPPRPTVVHRGVTCDACLKTIEGVRHKCLDCPDYDLCTHCMSSGHAERHNPFHEFFDIHEPGRVIVHTVNSRPERQSDAPLVPPPEQDENQVHGATCDLCDSRIVGVRYKCLGCPDFDTCASCFGITPEQHPRHAFAKMRAVSDYVRNDLVDGPVDRPIHFATCNSCNKGIYGIRYKCMHPNCPDFDLCEACEALPIRVHPSNHPFLKMRAPETLVPTVYRAGQDVVLVNEPMEEPVPQRPGSRASAFERGYMRNPFSDPGRVSPVIPPPSPFFYETRSRSPSPTRLIPGGLPATFFHHDSGRNSLRRSPSPPLDIYAPVTEFVGSFDKETPYQSVLEMTETRPGSFSFLTPQSPPLSSNVWPKRSNFEHLISETGSVENESVTSSQPLESQTALTSKTFPDVISQIIQSAKMSVADLLNEEPIEPIRRNVEDSPLSGAEALLSRPNGSDSGSIMVPAVKEPVSSGVQSLAALLEGYQSSSLNSSIISVSVNGGVEEHVSQPKSGDAPLQAEFLADITVNDGQIFPPGAEFMKCWRMVNSGTRDWPESTRLIFLAGDQLARDKSISPSVQVGIVKPGEELDIWTYELKAPDAPGRYVSYWRLSDDQGLFGVNIWLDITVAETGYVSSESSMSSSSVIIMPQTLNNTSPTRSTDGTVFTAPSNPDDAVSDDGSDGSSISLVSIPATLEEDEIQDVQAQINEEIREETEEYVVLYDDSSSEDD